MPYMSGMVLIAGNSIVNKTENQPPGPDGAHGFTGGTVPGLGEDVDGWPNKDMEEQRWNHGEGDF